MDLPENIQAGLANVNAKADIKAEVKAADTINNQFGGTTNIDNSKEQIINQNFYINVLHNINYDESIKKAFLSGNQNAEIVGATFQKSLADKNISQEYVSERLENPEILSIIAEANKIAYTENNVDKRKLLSDLLYAKITNTDDFKSITISSAIKTLPNLTETQLKILSLFFILQSSNFENLSINNWEDFQGMYNELVKPLLEYDTKNPEIEFFNLYSTGCVITSLLNIFRNKNYFYSTIRKFVSDKVPESEIDASLYQTLALWNIGFGKVSDQNYYIVDKEPFEFYESLTKQKKITDAQKESLEKLYVKYGYDCDELISQHIPFHENYQALISKVENYHFSFTPVGKEIARNYINLKLGIVINEE